MLSDLRGSSFASITSLQCCREPQISHIWNRIDLLLLQFRIRRSESECAESNICLSNRKNSPHPKGPTGGTPPDKTIKQTAPGIQKAIVLRVGGNDHLPVSRGVPSIF